VFSAHGSTLLKGSTVQTYLDCYPCFVRQALEAARLATDDERTIQKALDGAMAILQTIDLQSTPPEIGAAVHRLVREVTGNPDPYRAIKRASTDHALALYPMLARRVAASEDPFATAARLAIAGNIIDLGVPDAPYDAEALRHDIENVLRTPLTVDDMEALRAELVGAERVLYLGDNAGETVFDRLFIEQIAAPVTYVVKATPVLNDAVLEDAQQAGLDQVATLIDGGFDAPGTLLEHASPALRQAWADASVVIAKGQGNFEALSQTPGRVFFLLRAKCAVIAQHLSLAQGSLILKRSDAWPGAG